MQTMQRQSGYLMDDWDRISEMLERSPTKAVCRSEIKWTDIDGSKSSVCSDYHFHARDARKEALRMARKWGWTYPRWWQWWRWEDSRPNLDFSA
jgi:hypothetical protein